MERIPLKQRFEMAQRQDPEFLKLFDMHLCNYTFALETLIGVEKAQHISSEIKECFSRSADHKIMVLVAATIGLFEGEHEFLNNFILVEPFALMHEKENEK